MSSSRSRLASSASRNASASGFLYGATPTGASSPAWSTCRANGTTRTSGSACRTSCSAPSTVRTRSSMSGSPSPCSRACTSSSTPTQRTYPTTTWTRSRLASSRRPARRDNLYEALIEQCGEEIGTELFQQYREAFPPGYRDDFLARTAVVDIRRIEGLSSENDLGMSLYHPLEAPEDFLRFRLYRLGEQISLSEVMPLLEDMGVEVADQRPYKIEPAEKAPVWINDFGLVHEAQGELQTEQVKEIFQDAFARAWRGAVEDDGFNRLVLRAQLTWREITILRAYCKYLRQTGTTFSQNYMEQTLAANPHIARLLVELFKARLDPGRQERAEEETERLKEEIKEALEA